jgi:hypothetical protein
MVSSLQGNKLGAKMENKKERMNKLTEKIIAILENLINFFQLLLPGFKIVNIVESNSTTKNITVPINPMIRRKRNRD